MDNQTYFHILMDTLVKKERMIDEIIKISKRQEEYATTASQESKYFDDTFSEKQILIDKLTELDSGFEKVYDHVKNEIINNGESHKEYIKELQNIIGRIVEKSTRLEALEKKNKLLFDEFFLRARNELRDIKAKNKMAINYYKNMTNRITEESFFLDKKK